MTAKIGPVGVLGIGLVGTAIAERLLDAGFSVCGFDVNAERGLHLQTKGGRALDSPAAVGGSAKRVVLAVLDDNDIERVLWGVRGVMTGSVRPEVLISSTTSDPDRIAAAAQRCRAQGVALLDATISGSSGQVRKGDSVMMIGGEPGPVAASRDLFDAIAKQWFHVGPAGAGARAKLVVNLVLGLNRAALGEGIAFAEKLGLDARAMLEVLKSSAAFSQVMNIKGARMLERNYAPEGRLRQHAKDVSLMLAQAKRLGIRLPLSSTHAALLAQAIADGDGEIDNAAIVEVLRRQRFNDEESNDT
jgi:3-hydroxyisobutyrate dehydrogenase-like beta-hydroxyacid dehydrogenase